MYTIRASSWPRLSDCAYGWYFENVIGLKLPSSTASRVGTAVHAGAAAYDSGSEPAAAAEAALESFRNPADDVEHIGRIDAEVAAVTAMKSTASYINTFGRAPYSHIEVRIAECIIETDHGAIAVTGTVDRIINGHVKDVKTGVARVSKEGKVSVGADHLQLGIYALMAKAETGDNISNDVTIIGGSTAHYTWSEHTVQGAVQIMLGDGADDPGMVGIMAKMLKAGVFPPNPKSMLCSAKYCAAFAHNKCRYHGKG